MASVLEQFACENPEETTFYAAFVAPVRSLFGFSKHESLFIYAWIVLILIYIILYFVIPTSFLNSNNGFKSGWVTLLYTLLLFAVISFIYVLWVRDTACNLKSIKAAYYVFGRKPAQPKYLEQAIERVQSLPENRDRRPTNWRPQKPTIEVITETEMF